MSEADQMKRRPPAVSIICIRVIKLRKTMSEADQMKRRQTAVSITYISNKTEEDNE